VAWDEPTTDTSGSTRGELEGLDKQISRVADRQAIEMMENVHLLPPAEVMDRILRYQSAERRHLFRLLGELRQFQTERRGEAVPPALNAVGGA
jgi:hypothetical protein